MASRQEGSGATDAVTSCDASLEASRSISNQQRPHTHILRTGLSHLAMSNHTLALQPSSEKLSGGIWSYPNPNPNPNIKAGGKCFPSGSNYSWVLEEGRSFSTLMAAISCQHVKVDLGTLGGGGGYMLVSFFFLKGSQRLKPPSEPQCGLLLQSWRHSTDPGTGGAPRSSLQDCTPPCQCQRVTALHTCRSVTPVWRVDNGWLRDPSQAQHSISSKNTVRPQAPLVLYPRRKGSI